MRHSVLIINGPNLNSLGRREPEKYGRESLAVLQEQWLDWGRQHNRRIETLTSQFEGEILTALHAAEEEQKVAGVVINPGALTHTSRALRDAISSLSIPVVEVHLTNIAAREAWRRHSVISEVCSGTIAGFGSSVYLLGLTALQALLEGKA